MYRVLEGANSIMNCKWLRRAQMEYQVLQEKRKWVKGNPPEKKADLRGKPEDAHVYHKLLGVLDVDEGDMLLLKKRPGFNQEVERILIHTYRKVRDKVFKWSHFHPSARHFGAHAMCNMFLAQIQKFDLKGGHHQPRKHVFSGEVLKVDIVGPMTETTAGKRYTCTMQDNFSRYASAVMIA